MFKAKPAKLSSQLTHFYQQPLVKKAILILGVLFYIAIIFIAFKPEPFIRLGYPGVFAFNLFGPGTLLIPVLARRMNIIYLSLASAAGMALNDSWAWLVGKSGDVVFPRTNKVIRFEQSIAKYGIYAIFFWAFIPFPYDFIAIIAGYLELPYKKFVIPVFTARLIRFLLIGFATVGLLGTLN